jgi:hypothetical protein
MTSFIDGVLRLEPKLTAFDCDGTLWSGDAGESFFSWEMDHGLVSDDIARWALARHADYKAGRVSEEVMCGEMVTLHKGLEEAVIQEATDRFFEDNLVSGIFPEMQALLHRLHDNGCEGPSHEQSMDHSIRRISKFLANEFATEVRVVGGRDGSTDSYTQWSENRKRSRGVGAFRRYV